MIPFPIKRIQFDWIILVPFFLALKNVCLAFFFEGTPRIARIPGSKKPASNHYSKFFCWTTSSRQNSEFEKTPQKPVVLFLFCHSQVFGFHISKVFFFYQWTCSSFQKHIHKMSEIHNSSLMVDFWSQETFFSHKKKITRQEGGEEVQQLGKVCDHVGDGGKTCGPWLFFSKING